MVLFAMMPLWHFKGGQNPSGIRGKTTAAAKLAVAQSAGALGSNLSGGFSVQPFHDGARAFNWAERYQTTVIHLVDKALANSNGTMPVFDPDRVRIDRGELITDGWSGRDTYKRFAFTESGVSPRAVIGHPGTVFWNTGDEHDELGHITEDPALRNLMMEKRERIRRGVLKPAA